MDYLDEKIFFAIKPKANYTNYTDYVHLTPPTFTGVSTSVGLLYIENINV